MGKGGRGKSTKQKAGAEEDDALLEAAIAQTQYELQKMELEKQHVEASKAAEKQRALRAKVTAGVEAEVRDAAATPLTRQQICEKLDALPAFCIVDENKQFVQVLIPEEDVACCVFWTEPLEAQWAIKQAKQQRAGAHLSMGTIPLGKAFALCEGWAEAQAPTQQFRLRAHAQSVKQLRPVLTKQLEEHGMPAAQVFPLFTCEELTTDTVMPFFLSRAELVSTWEELQRQRGFDNAPPPAQMTVIDLRFLAQRMQAGGVDWSIVKLVGTERAHEAVRDATRQEGSRRVQEAMDAPVAVDDPEAAPPPLV